MKQIYLIAYDISKTKRRNKIAELLQQYGERVNLSVFECYLNKKQIKNISSDIKKIINKKTDTVKIYHICKTCYSKSFEIGQTKKDSKNITKFV